MRNGDSEIEMGQERESYKRRENTIMVKVIGNDIIGKIKEFGVVNKS